jgi:hypothetical protein
VIHPLLLSIASQHDGPNVQAGHSLVTRPLDPQKSGKVVVPSPLHCLTPAHPCRGSW